MVPWLWGLARGPDGGSLLCFSSEDTLGRQLTHWYCYVEARRDPGGRGGPGKRGREGVGRDKRVIVELCCWSVSEPEIW